KREWDESQNIYDRGRQIGSTEEAIKGDRHFSKPADQKGD
ncbi:unnamed protein product, partial [marine sediment metagenome]